MNKSSKKFSVANNSERNCLKIFFVSMIQSNDNTSIVLAVVDVAM